MWAIKTSTTLSKRKQLQSLNNAFKVKDIRTITYYHSKKLKN